MVYVFNVVTTNIIGYGQNLSEALESVLDRGIVAAGDWVATTFRHNREPVSMAEALAYVRIGGARLVAVGGGAVRLYPEMLVALAERVAEEFRRQAGIARDAQLDRMEARARRHPTAGKAAPHPRRELP